MTKLPSIRRIGMALAILSPALVAQERESLSANKTFEVAEQFSRWTKSNGANWSTHADIQTGYARMIYGGSAPAVFQPDSDGDFESLGLLAISSTAGMHGIEQATLFHDRSLHLPLGLTGSTDKFTVRFRQEVNGVPVLGGFVNTLFTPAGQLLSLQTTAMPGVANMNTVPAIGASTAAERALETFKSDLGLSGTITSGPTLAIGQLETDPKNREAVLVWETNVTWHEAGMEPEGITYWTDARNGGVIREQTSIQNFDVGGTVSTFASPGVAPDIASNPEVLFPMNRARVNGGAAGVVFTDADGNFNFPGVTGPIDVTFRYFGDWVDVNNEAGADYSEVFSLTGTGNNVSLNSGTGALVTSQSNSFETIASLRDWIRGVNPSDSTADFRATANANISSACNAFFNGSSVNFYQAGGGCVSTSYSTVSAHEMGHWYNVLYGTGNGSDGMGEGNSDVFALYRYNSPLLGLNFNGGGALRNGNNLRQYCGDSNPGCYGQVHADGEVWMGAAWKVYLQLEASLGVAQADVVSDALFMGWMNGFNQTGIHSIIETQWLVLDDDNGNIDDGTPNYAAIDAGFRIQGFPGFDLSLIGISNVTSLGTQNSEVGPYVVNADAISFIGGAITGVDLLYQVDNGSFTTLPMSSTGGDGWTAGIPGQNSPAMVRYYVRATDDVANTDVFPDNAPAVTEQFLVGQEVIVFSEDFEGGQAGWTHDTFGDTSNSQDDWQFGTPGGQSGDAGSAYSGSNAWGNDLSIGNFNGAYQSNVHNYLRSPNFDLSTVTGAHLRFKRWLTVEEGADDQARVSINGTQVWTNALNGNTVDTSWISQDIDISAIADGNSSVQIEFSLQSDGGLNFGGWTIDDVELVSITPVSGSCQTPTSYGVGKQTSQGGFPVLTTLGDPSVSGGSFTFELNGAIPNVLGLIFSSATSDSVPFFGGTRLVGMPIQREGSLTTDVLGSGAVLQPTAGQASGSTRFYQAWFRDAAHPDGTGFGLSDAVQVIFCD